MRFNFTNVPAWLSLSKWRGIVPNFDDSGSAQARVGIALLVVLVAGGAEAQPARNAVPPELRNAIDQRLRSIEPAGAGHYTALNPDNRMALNFDGDGLEIAPGGKPRDWRWSMKLTGYGTSGHLQPIVKAEVSASGQRLEYRRGAVTEWYENRPEGLEQGFTLARPPETAAAAVELRLGTGGDLKAGIEAGGRSARFRDRSGQEVLAYKDLSVIDANGKTLPAHLAAVEDQLTIEVDVRGAAWPVTVDPLIVSIQQKLSAQNTDGSGDTEQNAQLGYSVALSGDTALVGANGRDCSAGAGCGAAYVYTRTGTTWEVQQKLTAQNTDGSDDTEAKADFGIAVALDGDTALVGAQDRSCAGSYSCGAAYVYNRSGTTWSIEQKITAQNTDGTSDVTGFAEFGRSVALMGNAALIGADVRQCPGGAAGCGAAYVYTRSGGGWDIQKKLVALHTDGTDDQAMHAYFGSSVALSGDTALVGAPGLDCTWGGACGAAYLYARSGTQWHIQQKIFAEKSDGSDDIADAAHFGNSAALSGDTALVGASGRSCAGGASCGAAYVYSRSGTAWTIQQKITAQNPEGTDDAEASANFGNSVALSGDTALVGAWGRSCSAGASCGAAYVYRRTGTAWNIQGKMSAQNTDGSEDTQADAYFGEVALAGDTLLVGALGQSCAQGSHCGAAYVYTLRYALTVTNAGGGTVASNPAGIDCGSACGADFKAGSSVTLTAVPAAGYAFSGWSGCDSSVGATCQVTMNQAKAVTASFVSVTPTYNLSVVKNGKGKVTSAPAGVDCGPTCQGSFAQGSVVTLTATAAPKYLFLGWSGPCKLKVQGGTLPPQLLCEVTLNKSKQVKAKFVKVLP
ncbi:InlB B-repeat-containing protein [Methylococcus mesophilus]|uniref:InlB B-repeat-containing protein n=1 Tax=Methylococcus mesophilus TaxID=2993564 RepID=UPI00224B1A2C|nr:hypothetical protein [Methylococcus mesophilus]UZR27706.1 hypothetical protein OOT43_13325 [Methylococcus mesophilus]